MAYPRTRLPPKTLEEGRRLYEQTLVPLADVSKLLGITEGTLRKIARENGWRSRTQTRAGAKGAKLARERRKQIDTALAAPEKTRAVSGVRKTPPSGGAKCENLSGTEQTAPAAPSASSPDHGFGDAPSDHAARTALVARIQGAVEREIAAVEAILTTLGCEAGTPAAPDEAERAARTLASLARTLSELTRIECAASEARNAPAADAQEELPRDLDELRSALSRKLESFIAGRHPALPGES